MEKKKFIPRSLWFSVIKDASCVSFWMVKKNKLLETVASHNIGIGESNPEKMPFASRAHLLGSIKLLLDNIVGYGFIKKVACCITQSKTKYMCNKSSLWNIKWHSIENIKTFPWTVPIKMKNHSCALHLMDAFWVNYVMWCE